MSEPKPIVAPASKAQQQEFSKALAEALLDDKVQRMLVLDVDTYTKTTKMVEDKFRTVYNKLKAFDEEGLGSKDSIPLHESWGGYQTRFTKLLKQSRALAGEMADSCFDYLTTIVKPAAQLSTVKDIQEAALKALIKDIDRFLKEAKDMEAKAETTQDEFNGLASDIKTFRDNFEKYGEGRKTANLKTIAQLDLAIMCLRAEITELETEISSMGSKMLGTGIAINVVGSIVSAFCPLAAWAIFGAGLLACAGEGASVLYWQGQIRDKNKEIKEKEKTKASIQAENARIDAIRTELAQMGKREIADVLAGLEFFRYIWACVTTDVHSIRNYLEKIISRISDVTDPTDPTEFTPSVYQCLSAGTTFYYGLSRGLKLYQVGAEKADTIKFGIPMD